MTRVVSSKCVPTSSSSACKYHLIFSLNDSPFLFPVDPPPSASLAIYSELPSVLPSRISLDPPRPRERGSLVPAVGSKSPDVQVVHVVRGAVGVAVRVAVVLVAV